MAQDFVGAANPLSSQGLQDVCAQLGVEAPEIWAVLTVETSGCGFLADKRPAILFERHIFHRQTGGQFDAAAPEVSNPAPGGYGPSGAHQYDRLAQAIALDREAALRSASWGIGQVMGMNAEAVGFADVETMVEEMSRTEDQQLKAVAGFIEANHIADALRAHEWADFARVYNGATYAENQYDTKLEAAFARLSAGPLPDLGVRAAQVYLRFCGIDPGPVDGRMGRATRLAAQQFRQREGLPDGDGVDDVMLAQLQAASATV